MGQKLGFVFAAAAVVPMFQCVCAICHTRFTLLTTGQLNVTVYAVRR